LINCDKSRLGQYLVKIVLFLSFGLAFLSWRTAFGDGPNPIADPKPSQVAKDLGLEFILIEPGTFVMGAEPKLERFTSYALPKHEVTISQSFFIGKYEVTQRQWMAIMDLNPSKFKSPSNPVDSVSWYKAQEFVDKLNQKEGRVIFRLPTEAEWEFVARAGSDTVYTFGNLPTNLGDYAWFTNNDKYAETLQKNREK
jgi:formylglycine-generating enzyme required for sulfatase activity